MKSLAKRKLSNIGRDILKSIPNSQVTNIDCGNSIISVAHNNSEAMKRKRRRSHFASSLCISSVGTSTATNYIMEDHLKIDRIFYNFYGDVASIIRKVKVYDETHPCGDNETPLNVRSTQNESIKQFIEEFLKQQPEHLLGAIAELEITSNSSDQCSNVSEEEVVSSIVETSNNSVEENRADGSSVYSYKQMVTPTKRRNEGNKAVSPVEENKTPVQQRFNDVNANDNSGMGSRKKFRFDVDQLFSVKASSNNAQSPVSDIGFHGSNEFNDNDNDFEYGKCLSQRNVPIQYKSPTNERVHKSKSATKEGIHHSKNTMKEASDQRKNIDSMKSGRSEQNQRRKFDFDMDDLFSSFDEFDRANELNNFGDNNDFEDNRSHDSFFSRNRQIAANKTPINSQFPDTSQLIFTGPSENTFDSYLNAPFTPTSNNASNRMFSPDESLTFRNINRNVRSAIQNLNSHQSTQNSNRTPSPTNESMRFSNQSNGSIRPNLQRLKSLSNASQFSNSQRSMLGIRNTISLSLIVSLFFSLLSFNNINSNFFFFSFPDGNALSPFFASQKDFDRSDSLRNNAGSRTQSSDNSTKVKITRKIPKSNLKHPITFGDRSNIFSVHHYKNVANVAAAAPKPKTLLPNFNRLSSTATNYTHIRNQLRRLQERKANQPSKLALYTGNISTDQEKVVETVRNDDAIDKAAKSGSKIDENLFVAPPSQFDDEEISGEMVIPPPTQFS